MVPFDTFDLLHNLRLFVMMSLHHIILCLRGTFPSSNLRYVIYGKRWRSLPMDVEKLSSVVRVKSTKVYEAVVLQIQALIAQGKLLPGEKLPPERELAERFGVGRNSVREAVRQLELLGLVEVRQGEGTFISRATIDNVIAPFVSVLVQNPNLYGEILDFRKMLEPKIAALAAERATPENIAKMEELILRFEKYVASSDSRLSATIEDDGVFHYVIAEATQNRLIVRVVSAVMDLLKEFLGQLSEAGYHSDTFVEIHRSILEAIKARDVRGSRLAMEKHMEVLQQYMQEVTKAAETNKFGKFN